MGLSLEVMQRLTELSAFKKVAVILDAILAPYTTYRIGGPCLALITANTVEGIQETLKLAKENDIPLFVMGGGSNLLVSDEGFPGFILKLSRDFADVEYKDGLLTCGGAMSLRQVLNASLMHGCVGLERCAGIPGSFAGALAMNAGSASEYLGEFVEWVELVSYEGELLRIPGSEINWDYRYSGLQERGIIIRAALRLESGDVEKSKEYIKDYLLRRRKTQPLDKHNAGSVFKNPPGHSAGALIEECGLKGFRVGNAQISKLHANFIVNLGGASAKDVLDLIAHTTKEVYKKHAIQLEQELKVLG